MFEKIFMFILKNEINEGTSMTFLLWKLFRNVFFAVVLWVGFIIGNKYLFKYVYVYVFWMRHQNAFIFVFLLSHSFLFIRSIFNLNFSCCTILVRSVYFHYIGFSKKKYFRKCVSIRLWLSAEWADHTFVSAFGFLFR